MYHNNAAPIETVTGNISILICYIFKLTLLILTLLVICIYVYVYASMEIYS